MVTVIFERFKTCDHGFFVVVNGDVIGTALVKKKKTLEMALIKGWTLKEA